MDLISRQAAIDICKKISGNRCLSADGNIGAEMCAERIAQLPLAQPTLYGYNIEHLELIARVLQKENLPPERIVEVLTDIGRIVSIVKDEYEEALRKAVE